MFCPRCHRSYSEDHRYCVYDGEPLADGQPVDHLAFDPSDQSGRVLGKRYELRRALGAGSMGQVYLAKDKRTGGAVAVKLLDETLARGPLARARFFREALAAARVEHPAVVRILDVGVHIDGVPYLVLEYLFGESLGELLRRVGALTADLALPILIRAAMGVGAAHQAHIVHRDVKPDNIFLVGEKGEPYAVKLLDFGLAQLDSQSGLTRAGVAAGTIEYMAPEQVVGDVVDERTDVYALGVVMYRVFAGRLPLSADDPADLLAHQLVSPPPTEPLAAAGVPPSVESIIVTCLRKDPANRYPRMASLEADLRSAVGLGALGGGLGGLQDFSLGLPLSHAPDRYVPRSIFSQNVARVLYRRLGIEPPDLLDAAPPAGGGA